MVINMENKDFIVERDGKQFVDVVKLLPHSIPSGKIILWRGIDEERVEISVDKSSARGGNAKAVVIKRFVEINEDLFELFGLRMGDGIRKQAEENTLGFSNTNLDLIKEFLRVVKIAFGIDSFQFKCGVQLTSQLAKNVDSIEKNISTVLKIPLDNFWNPRINEKRNTAGIDIRNDSRLWGIILNGLLDNVIMKFVFENKSFSAKVLQGIIASEANIFVRKEGRLSDIMIAAEGEDKRNFIRQLLLLLDVQPNKDKTIPGNEGTCINGLSNFRKMKEWNLVDLQPNKLTDFERGLQGFKKEEFRKGEGKLLILQSLRESSKRAFELSKELDRTQKAINWTMNKLEKKGLVENFRISRNIFWKLTEDGSKLINNGVTLEKLKNN